MRALFALILFSASIFLTSCTGTMKTSGVGDLSSQGFDYTYSWQISQWSACSAVQCGTQGTQNRTVQCLRDQDNVVVADSFCPSPKPSLSQTCSAPACGAASCTLDGVTVLDNQSYSFFNVTSVPTGQTCTTHSLSRTCHNGVLSGDSSYNHANCTVQAAAACNLPWGGTIQSGQSVTAFQAATVQSPNTCVSQTRTCTNGTLSGTYTNASCVVQGGQTGNGIIINLAYVNTSSSQYTRFKAYVDRAIAGNPDYGYDAFDPAYMYKISGQAQYCTEAVSLVEAQVAAAEAAIAANQNPAVAGDSYLEVGDYIGELALTYDWCSTFVTANQKNRWAAYASQAIYNVWHPSQASWGGRLATWSGWSINDPGNNYYYSFVMATMYWGLAYHDSSLISFLQTDKLPAITNYFNAIPGGGSLEGTGYGTSFMRLFEIFQTWKDSTGQDLANANSHVTNTIRYWVYNTMPTRDKFAPIGDQARVSEPTIYDYQRRLILEARNLTNDTAAQTLAAWWLNNISINPMSSSFNYRYDLLPAGSASTPAPSDFTYFAQGTGVLASRNGWATTDMWMNFIAGPYNQSHAHQEQGAFTLYGGSSWMTATENMWTHSGIQQGTDTNNVIRFVKNGAIIPQRQNTASVMTLGASGANGEIHASANISPVYQSSDGIQWTRAIDFLNSKLTVHDTYSVGSGTTAYFQVNVPTAPTVSGQVITTSKLKITVVSPANATISIVNFHSLDPSEYNSGYRVDISGGSGDFKVEFTQP